MARRYIATLGENENIDEVFIAAEKQMRTNRNGNPYLQLRLTDRSGAMTAMMWNAGNQVYGSFEAGDYVRVQGNTQYYNGAVQVIATRVSRVDAKTVDETEFTPLASADVDRYARRLAEMLRGLKNYHLRSLAEAFLTDDEFMSKFCRAPAGVKNHHAYRGGLLEHVVSLMELCAVVAPRYKDVDADLLLMGAFLHDSGKIDELLYDRELSYSDEGQLIGHVVMALGMVDRKLPEAEKLSGEPFPVSLALQIKHMVLSHHGEYEFGSPKLPMTLEAVALAYLDNLDAKLHSFAQLMREDINTESRWTPYQANIGRKLYKSGAEGKGSEIRVQGSGKTI